MTIYYVVHCELADDCYEQFKKRFEGLEGVEVIVDRRQAERRDAQEHGDKRVLRDRRRPATGTFYEV